MAKEMSALFQSLTHTHLVYIGVAIYDIHGIFSLTHLGSHFLYFSGRSLLTRLPRNAFRILHKLLQHLDILALWKRFLDAVVQVREAVVDVRLAIAQPVSHEG